MTVALRVVLDQLVAPTDDDLAAASMSLARGLVAATPPGCEVAGIVPSCPPDQLEQLGRDVAGLADVHRAVLPRRELAAAWQLGAVPGVGGGMIHSPTLFAPLARHDRVHDHDQTVVTLWDLSAWESPDELPRPAVAWQRAMLKRAVRHADAVVVPTHAMAVRLADRAQLGERVRVVAGAPAVGFASPPDAPARREALGLPPDYAVVSASLAPSAGLSLGLSAVAHALRADPDLHVVVLGAGEGDEPAVADAAAAAGIPERRVHVRDGRERGDRAAVTGGARAFVAPARQSAFPWRVLEALELGVPVVAAASDVHAEVVFDGGLVVGRPDAEVDAEELGAAVQTATGDTQAAARLRVLATDRARAFSWREAAERVWQLHADL
ncbi:MAG: glycosyltransferase [Microbacterium sp.]|uniref:glycosyltransferase n=1 Tax=Microbacterium sp. TaxID=51671 RepID=UPI0039E4D298